jgi:hypothetical protein
VPGSELGGSGETGKSGESGDVDTLADAQVPAVEDPGTPEPEPASVAKPERRPRDYCFIHEDSYTLLKRSGKRQSVVKATDGQCYECRREKRQNRIERFSYKCGGYFVCNTTDASRCN